MEQLDLLCFYPAEKPQTVVIPIGTDALVTELLEKIHGRLKQRDPNFDVAECDLSLYKANLPSKPLEGRAERARKWILDNLESPLDLADPLYVYFPAQPPPFAFHIVVADPELRHELSMQPQSSPLGSRYKQLTMTTSGRGFVTLQDLADNGIVEESTPHSRIVEFQDMLQTTPRYKGLDLFKYAEGHLRDLLKASSSSPQPQAGVVPAAEDLCARGRKFVSVHALPHFTPVPNDSANPDPNNGTAPDGSSNARECSPQEIAHVNHVLLCDFSQTVGAGEKGHYCKLQAYAAVFSPFGYSLAAYGGFRIGCTTNWPFHIYIETNHELYSYLPKSDFQFSPAIFPVFLAEIQSETTMKDDKCMKLQAAALVRFANAYLKKHKTNRSFFLVTAYINRRGVLERRVFYQDEQQGKKVKYTAAKVFQLTEKRDHLSFLCELYNLASWAAENTSGNDAQDEGVQRDALYDALRLKPTLPGWTSVNKPARKAPDSGFEGEGRPAQRARTGGVGDEGEPAEQLEALGYQVEPLTFEDAFGVWERLDRRPSTIRTVYEQSDVECTNPLIAKQAPKSSQELEILQHLRAQSSPPQYIVALFRHVAIGDTMYLIFPSLEPISEESLRGGRIQQPCQSLVAGVGYLHKHGVAHLDLKPDNLLYDARTRELKIINFDIAVLVENEEQEVEGYRGTRGWTAPEVCDGQRYSAIRADRWACGHILKGFLGYTHSRCDRGLWNLARRLLAESPRNRPSLIGWRQADSGACSQDALS